MKIDFGGEDFKIWKDTKSGEYSEKSEYWLASQSPKSQIGIEAEQFPSINLLKKKNLET